jgi:hypothetical protein
MKNLSKKRKLQSRSMQKERWNIGVLYNNSLRIES